MVGTGTLPIGMAIRWAALCLMVVISLITTTTTAVQHVNTKRPPKAKFAHTNTRARDTSLPHEQVIPRLDSDSVPRCTSASGLNVVPLPSHCSVASTAAASALHVDPDLDLRSDQSWPSFFDTVLDRYDGIFASKYMHKSRGILEPQLPGAPAASSKHNAKSQSPKDTDHHVSRRQRMLQAQAHIQAINITIHNTTQVVKQPTSDESYTLHVDAPTVTIIAQTIWGAQYALETFSQLLEFHQGSRNPIIYNTPISIVDSARYPVRGLMLDTANHFLPVSSITQTLDIMSACKMNVLHWHIVDSYSFPLQVPQHPVLSQKGAWDASESQDYAGGPNDDPKAIYTLDDLNTIKQYALERGVRVLMEVDVPGHAYSWGLGYPNITVQCPKIATTDIGAINIVPLNPTLPFTYKVLESVLTSVMDQVPDDWLHTGGDELQTECWLSDQEIQAWMVKNKITTGTELELFFYQQLWPFLKQNKRRQVVWEEVYASLTSQLPTDTIVHVWNNGSIASLAMDAGHDVILSENWYLDRHSPVSNAQIPWFWLDTWADMYNVSLANSTKGKVLGGVACMWGEQVSALSLNSRIWPRAIGISERLWSQHDVRNQSDAAQRIGRHRCRLAARGYPVGPIWADYCSYDALVRLAANQRLQQNDEYKIKHTQKKEEKKQTDSTKSLMESQATFLLTRSELAAVVLGTIAVCIITWYVLAVSCMPDSTVAPQDQGHREHHVVHRQSANVQHSTPQKRTAPLDQLGLGIPAIPAESGSDSDSDCGAESETAALLARHHHPFQPSASTSTRPSSEHGSVGFSVKSDATAGTGGRSTPTTPLTAPSPVFTSLPQPVKPKAPRLKSLDVFRGFTVALMVFVDNVGEAFPSIHHSPWDGVRLADFVMPFFDFIVGVSITLAFKRFDASPDVEVPSRFGAFKKATTRFLKLFVIGIWTQCGIDFMTFDLSQLRIMGILQRVAVCYYAVALMEIFLPRQRNSRNYNDTEGVTSVGKDFVNFFWRYKYHWLMAAFLFAANSAVMYGVNVPPAFGHECGRGVLTPPCNAAGYIDRLIFTESHMYFPANGGSPDGDVTFQRMPNCSSCSPGKCTPPQNAPAWCMQAPFDPEGLISSLNAIVTTILGLHCGHVLQKMSNPKMRFLHCTWFGLLLLSLGLALHFSNAILMNTDLYSISYTLVTGGTASLFLVLCYVIIDVFQLGWWLWKPFMFMGMNAITMYLCAEGDIIDWFLSRFYIQGDPDKNLANILWPTGVYWGDSEDWPAHPSHNWRILVWTLGYIGFWMVVAWWMWKNNIFVIL
eukprot:m.44964 g.44964  ORF g.44964 m.44964 type:complete len:1294 (+) comp10858_c0_seq5:36-3917(+)